MDSKRQIRTLCSKVRVFPREGKPMLVWAEGGAKLGHISGKDSCGAFAQILLNNRVLMIR